MNELQATLEGISALQTILITAVFFLGMTLFTAKLSTNSIAWAFVALIAVFLPIAFAFVMFI